MMTPIIYVGLKVEDRTEYRMGHRLKYNHEELEEILRLVTQTYDVHEKHLTGKSRAFKIVLARHVAQYIMRKSGVKLVDIARIFNRDHATVNYGVSRVEYDMERDSVFKKLVLKLIKRYEEFIKLRSNSDPISTR